MDETSKAIPTCPGCHFGCTLDDYQCARGGRFYEKWQAGEEIPVRRPPWEHGEKKPEGAKGGCSREGTAAPQEGAPKSQDGPRGDQPAHTPPPHFAKIPPSARIKMLLTVANRILGDRDDAVRDQRVAECIMRQDGSATNRIIAERTKLDDAAIDEQIAVLTEAGVVTSRTLEDGRTFHDLTETGRTQVETWVEEHRAADAEFFAALSDDEAAQLESLLSKVLEPHMRRGPRPKR